MKKIRGVMIAGTVLLGMGLSAAPTLADNDIGCGIGTTLMEGQEGLLFHLLGSMTNGATFQSVSLTFNLFGCDSTGTITADAQLRKFAAANLDQLARDVARGEGESLDAFAHLLQVPSGQRATFAVFTQSHFLELFPSQEVDSNEMVDAFYDLLGVQIVQG